MDDKYRSEPTPTDRLKTLAKHADVSVSTLGRMLEAEVGPNIDTLERVALALNCSVSDLLVAPPQFLQALGFHREA
jgi:transcriptional regulator with XRE-family HTH domain